MKLWIEPSDRKLQKICRDIGQDDLILHHTGKMFGIGCRLSSQAGIEKIIKLKQPNDSNVFSFDIDTQNGKKSIAIATPTIEPLNAIKLELESFVDSIVNNKPTAVSEIDGFLAMEVAHQILEKINNTSILV